VPVQRFTLGSASPRNDNPYRGLWTLVNTGAAVERMELSSSHFRDLEDRSGYLGHLAAEDAPGGIGAKINIVGPATPAAEGELEPGDIITEINGHVLSNAESLATALSETRPGDSVKIAVNRDGKSLSLQTTLARRPLEVVRPESMRANIPEALAVVKKGD